MIEKVKQYKNLILLAVAVLLVIGIIAADPLGFCAQRAHDRAAVYNQIAIEKAEAQKQIAIIQAQMDAELKRIAECEGAETDPSDPSAGAVSIELDTPREEDIDPNE